MQRPPTKAARRRALLWMPGRNLEAGEQPGTADRSAAKAAHCVIHGDTAYGACATAGL